MICTSQSGSEVVLAGAAQALCDLGESLCDVSSATNLPTAGDLKRIRLDWRSESSAGLLSLTLGSQELMIAGDSDAFDKLGESLQNVFRELIEIDARSHAIAPHLHVDEAWPNMVERSNCSLVFQLDR